MRVLFLILIIVLSCTACNPPAAPVAKARVVQLEAISLRYQPAELVTESPLELTVSTPADWILQKAELVSISMDMLTMPLFFRRQPTQENQTSAVPVSANQAKLETASWHTQFLLGACADPQMRWRLQLEFRDSAGQLHQRQDEFVVSRR